MIEQHIAIENLRHPGSGFYYFRTQTGVEIDLIIDRGLERIGCEFKAGASVDSDDWRHLRTGIAEGVVHRGIVIYSGTQVFSVSETISVIPAAQVLGFNYVL